MVDRPDAIDPPDRSEPDAGAPLRRISRNGIAAMSNVAAGMLSGFVLIPVLLDKLGTDSYGLYALSMGVAAYAGFLDFGINATLTKMIAEHRARGDYDGSGPISTLTSTAFFVYLLLGLAGASVLLLMALPAVNVFGLGAAEASTFRQVALVLAIQVGLSLPLSVWNSALSGLQDYHLIYFISIASTLGRFGVVLVLLHAGIGVVGLTLVSLGTACATWFGNYLLARWRLPGLRIRPSRFDKRETRRLVKFSGSMLIWSVAGYALHNADRVILGFNARLGSIASYDIGARLTQYSRGSIQGWLDTLLPHSSELQASAPRSSIRRTFLQGSRSLLLVYGLVAVCVFVVGQRFLQWWIGSRYEHAFTILWLLVLASLFQAQNLVGHVMLVGVGRLRSFTIVMASYPVVIFSLGWLGARHFGARGMAGALLASTVLLEGAFMPAILREFGVPFGDFMRQCQAPLVGGVLGGLGLGWAAMSVMEGATLPVLIAGALMATVGYTAGYVLTSPRGVGPSQLLRIVRRRNRGR